ncbi:hypothetical protein BJ170DRAFT_628294 [Xylariales sp. AK1849]|nr:hypothetical protein BJ170DRAFT_628294 [Xylariales sp. AK1849]
MVDLGTAYFSLTGQFGFSDSRSQYSSIALSYIWLPVAMARKGSRKVKTGCHTCKIRKVKCDEAKPECSRCTSTGRKCDGYAVRLEPGLTWYRPNHLFQSVDQPLEGRALQFFCEKVGPSLSGPLDPYFWTHLVLQFSNFEPAVRHSIISISSLYEDFNAGRKQKKQLQAKDFALRHYNAAIENLRTINNEPLVLLVCLLFVCVEILRGNREAAIQHCRHGIIILVRIGASYPWAIEHLSPVFRRLSIIPLFFGCTIDSFPQPNGLDAPVPSMFASFGEAQYYIDAIICRASRLVRRGDAYRYGKHLNQPVPDDLLSTQLDLQRTLDAWRSSMHELETGLALSEEHDIAYCNLMLRYNVSCIWIDMAFEPNETMYDTYLDDFQSVVARAAQLGPVMKGGDTSLSQPRFSFEASFLPFVVFAVVRCRDLKTRLRALALIQESCVVQENLWEAPTMYLVCKRLVEVEHDIILDKSGQPIGQVAWKELPTEVMRVKDFASRPESVMQANANEPEAHGGLANFAMRTAEGEVWIRREFISGPAPMPYRECRSSAGSA